MYFHAGIAFAQLLCTTLAFAAAPPHHYDLEMTGAEYAAALEKDSTIEFNPLEAIDTNGLDQILRVGQRNLDWLTYINQHRNEGTQLSFSTPDTQLAYPVEKPKVYNPAIIRTSYDELVAVLPQAMKDVLLNGAALTANPVLEEAEYLTWGLRVDRAYQNAARWRLLSPYLNDLARRKTKDIRGYYFFLKEQNLKKQLEDWSHLATEKKQLYRSYLLGMCLNNAVSNCVANVDAQLAKNAAYPLYERFRARSQRLYEGFYNISTARRDVKWDNRDNSMHVPFVLPDETFRLFLKDNIEDEWKWNAWRLVLDFVANANPFSTPHLVFVPGATPHVNGLAGNEITMDGNAPLTEYNVRWTIRHEYGHVLGFPDCYHEFYDTENSVMISYQLDITDLMCSRRGHLKERHYSDLKRTYN